MSIRINGKLIASVGGGGSGSGSNILVDEQTIVSENSMVTTVGMKSKSGDVIHDWVGTLAEYNAGVEDGSIKDNWVCWVTDDNGEYDPAPATGFNIFDTKIADHILEGEEAVGWALQGTYVDGKTYPHFYNKCLEEYQNENSHESYLKSNIIKVGSLTNNNGVLSNFSETSYATLPNSFSTVASCEIVFKANISDFSKHQVLLSRASGTNSSVIIIRSTTQKFSFYGNSAWVDGLTTLNVNTNYWFSVVYNGTNFIGYLLEDNNYTEDTLPDYSQWSTEWTTTLNILDGYLFNIGYNNAETSEFWRGSVDLNNSYININGSRWWSGVDTIVQNQNGHKFYPIEQKSTFDQIYNECGIADFYGIDEENERIFLPRNKYFAITGEVPVAGNGMSLGLTDGTGTYFGIREGESTPTSAKDAYGVPVGTEATGSSYAYNDKAWGITTDPTKSGIEAHLTSNESKYLYYCVGNTNVEVAYSDITELTSTENDTIPLFTGMYFDFNPNNVSWLKAGQQQNSGGIYRSCYNELVKIINGINPYNLQVIEEKNMEADVDYSLYWILDQDNLTFRTPLTIATKSLSGGVVGNGLALGLTDGTENYGLSTRNINSNGGLGATTSGWGQPIGTSTSGFAIDAIATGVTTDPTKSGIIAEQSTAQLYFKVANAVQNLELLDAGEVLEAVTDKISHQDCPAYIVETYKNGTSWYRIYSDGWCEQGGELISVLQDTTTTVNLLKSFANANYSVMITATGGERNNTQYMNGQTVQSRTISSFVMRVHDYTFGRIWQASGYIA